MQMIDFVSGEIYHVFIENSIIEGIYGAEKIGICFG